MARLIMKPGLLLGLLGAGFATAFGLDRSLGHGGRSPLFKGGVCGAASAAVVLILVLALRRWRPQWFIVFDSNRKRGLQWLLGGIGWALFVGACFALVVWANHAIVDPSFE